MRSPEDSRSIHRAGAPRGPRHATLLVDVDDLYSTLRAKLPEGTRPETVILDALRALPALLGRLGGLRVQAGQAYGDFSAIPDAGPFQRDLHALGAEPVYTAGQPNAAELALAMDAAALVAAAGSPGAPDPGAFVLVVGARAYAPLVRRLRRDGRRVHVLAAEPPADAEGVISLFDLAPEAAKAAAPAEPRPPREGIDYRPITDPDVLRALEVIEEFFGQYDEVYLTPLLRKLTEEFETSEADPKVLISDLEGVGAVYLEKRRGYPHDYTVLLVDDQHPDVERVRSLFEDDDEDEDAGGYRGDGDGYADRAPLTGDADEAR